MSNVDTNIWEHLASDREARRNLIPFGVEEFENNKVAYAALKCAGYYMEDVTHLNQSIKKSPSCVMNVDMSIS